MKSTSAAALKSIEGGTASLRFRVLSFLRSRPRGATDEEMQNELGMNPNTQRPRRRELENAGLIMDSLQVRNTASGRKAVVWVVTRDAVQLELVP